MKIMVQMPAGTSSVSVAGQHYEASSTGIVTVDSPEHVAPLVAHGGFLVGEDGAPVGDFEGLRSTEIFSDPVDMGEGREARPLADVVADAQARTQISRDDWNNLPQRVRDILVGFQVAHERGEMTSPDEVTALRARIADLEAAMDAPAEDDTSTKPDFSGMTIAQIGDWVTSNGGEAPTGNKDAFVSAAEARWAELHPAQEG